MFYRFARVVLSLGILTLLTSCDYSRTGEQQVNQKQAEITDSAALAVPFPKITTFQEMRILSKLYTVRDQSLNTFTYSQAMDGTLTKLCNSYGFGIPYGTQFSNPEKLVWSSGYGYVSTPQAEPNGTYTNTATTKATWVLCFGDGGIYPFYWEGDINASPVEISGPMVKGAFNLNFAGKTPVITNEQLAEIQKPSPVSKQTN